MDTEDKLNISAFAVAIIAAFSALGPWAVRVSSAGNVAVPGTQGDGSTTFLVYGLAALALGLAAFAGLQRGVAYSACILTSSYALLIHADNWNRISDARFSIGWGLSVGVLAGVALIVMSVLGLRDMRREQLKECPELALPEIRFVAFLIDLVLRIVTLMIGWLIWSTFTARHGQTPGKKMMGLNVVEEKSLDTVGLKTMFWKRGVYGLLVAFTVPLTAWLILFMPFWDKQARTIWDYSSRTRVVRVSALSLDPLINQSNDDD